jgi:hypothetical protein
MLSHKPGAAAGPVRVDRHALGLEGLSRGEPRFLQLAQHEQSHVQCYAEEQKQ